MVIETPQPIEPLLTMHEVAIILRVSDRTVRRLVSVGELPAPVMILGAKRFRPEDVRRVRDGQK